MWELVERHTGQVDYRRGVKEDGLTRDVGSFLGRQQ